MPDGGKHGRLGRGPDGGGRIRCRNGADPPDDPSTRSVGQGIRARTGSRKKTPGCRKTQTAGKAESGRLTRGAYGSQSSAGALSKPKLRVGGVSGMALATGPIEWTLPLQYRRLAPCRSRIWLPAAQCNSGRCHPGNRFFTSPSPPMPHPSIPSSCSLCPSAFTSRRSAAR